MSPLIKLSIQFFITVSSNNFVLLKNSLSLNQKFISYVPAHSPVTKSDIDKLTEFLLRYKGKIAVLTGAGISTESGIPDYRSKDVGLFARSNHKPMTYQKFTGSDIGRKRYWARSFIAWPNYSSIAPNSIHNAIQTLEEKQFISTVITQNVDSLHHKAGSKNVIELHGSLYRVICIKCYKYMLGRYKFQEILESMNPKFNVTPQMVRPDGDVDLPEEYVHSFNTPNCPRCNGYLKPDVTFFGESIPIERVDKARKAIDESNSLLVLGSSVSVFSAYRILLQANDTNKPICIVNIGPTRGDEIAAIKISAKCGEILEKVLPLLN